VSGWELTNIAVKAVLPPGGLILLGLLGFALMRSRTKSGVAIALFALVSLYLLSMPIVGRSLLQTIEAPHVDPATDPGGGAIVVLGGGSYHRAPEYRMDTVSRHSLERVRYAAHLQRRTGKPILVTGGDPAGSGSTEAEQMKVALAEFGASTRWTENASKNTLENARLVQKILREAGVDSVYVVTHAWHMPRAKLAFARSGLRVIPAPMGYTSRSRTRVLDFFPSAPALENSAHFFHEIAGLAWYRLQFARER
jgi:uncharacterized SAM-binding protein YcdF (DUF218 family)